MSTTPGDSELLTDDDLTRLTAIKRGTLRALRSRGQIPYVRLGGGRIIRYRRADIEQWIASRAVGAR